ncbi:glycosyltransferase family 2 protein [Candidatus Pseudothioglobus singularis]|nr:glycosyltransferase family 2 protein [Candidatus Pseudothioglobus singularis]
MKKIDNKNIWKEGSAPISVIMISLNEAHNMIDVLENLNGWAKEVHLVDSCSHDSTVSIALSYGVKVVQRNFNGFGEQWNFALENLPISAPWVMKLDPDERITDELKNSIERIIKEDNSDGVIIKRRLHFMGKTLPITQSILRLWKNGTCRFTNVNVNEHPLVNGTILNANGYLEHHDSPNLDHWLTKQNSYTTLEAVNQYMQKPLGISPKLFGSTLEKRMWVKSNFWKIPGRYILLFSYHYFILGAWRSGKVGWKWSHLRTEVYRLWEYKYFEMKSLNKVSIKINSQNGLADNRVRFYKDD